MGVRVGGWGCVQEKRYRSRPSRPSPCAETTSKPRSSLKHLKKFE